MSRLTAGEIKDEAGMASTVLAADVGYPGSSIAFAQLLSGMERSGLIEREVRGKRTYRIAAAAGALAGHTAATPNGRGSTAKMPTAPGRDPYQAAPPPLAAAQDSARHLTTGRLTTGAESPAEFDYDELARRLLIQVVRQLAAGPAQAATEDHDDGTLERTVAGLERELASVRTLHGNLTQENARLREQLRAARRSLALAQERSAGQQVADELDAAEVGLLERLLTPATSRAAALRHPVDRRPTAGRRGEDAETG